MCKAFMIFLSEICDLKVDSFGGSLLVGDGSDCQSSLFPLFFFFFLSSSCPPSMPSLSLMLKERQSCSLSKYLGGWALGCKLYGTSGLHTHEMILLKMLSIQNWHLLWHFCKPAETSTRLQPSKRFVFETEYYLLGVQMLRCLFFLCSVRHISVHLCVCVNCSFRPTSSTCSPSCSGVSQFVNLLHCFPN